MLLSKFLKKGLALHVLIIIPYLLSCSSPGDPAKQEIFLDIDSSIRSQVGDQSSLEGWVVALVDRESLISRVGVVDSTGNFTLNHVSKDKTYTIVLISPSFIFQSAFVSRSETVTNKYYQFFKITGDKLPILVHEGKTVEFLGTDGIEINKTISTPDSNNNNIPDGLENLIKTNTSIKSQNADTDSDGVVNSFDSDDDNDGIYDLFDSDSNGDDIIDNKQQLSDLYFPTGIKWINIKYELQSNEDGTLKRSLVFNCELHEKQDIIPAKIAIRGPQSLLNNGTVISKNESGEDVSSAWDKTLLDDGLNEDSIAGDLLYGRRITLDSTKVPEKNQVIFFQLVYSDGWTREYAYTFPPVEISSISSTYESSTRTTTLVGNPFGENFQTFKWIVTIFEVSGSNLVSVFTSSTKSGEVRTIEIPTNTFEVGKTYKRKVTAILANRIPSMTPYSIESTIDDL